MLLIRWWWKVGYRDPEHNSRSNERQSKGSFYGIKIHVISTYYKAFVLNWVIWQTMPRFSEVVLLLVSFTLLPLLFVNGSQVLRPAVNYKLSQRNAVPVIRGLLFSRQQCESGFNVCSGSITGCCPVTWKCCSSSSFSSTILSFSPVADLVNFLRWRLLSA